MKKIFIVLGSFILLALAFVSADRFVAYGEIDDTQRLKGAVVLYVGSPVAQFDNVEKQIDLENADITPIVKNDRCLVPIRFISETLGGGVNWDEASSTVTVNYNNKQIKMIVGKNDVFVAPNDGSLGAYLIKSDVAPEIINNRTYVPFRIMAESLGKKVFYDRGLIIISDRDKIFDIKKDKSKIDSLIKKINNLPVVGSYEKLTKLLGDVEKQNNSNKQAMLNAGVVAAEERESSKTKNDAAQSASDSSVDESDYSKTNVQVEGVDEADVVKTDGEYIYQVNNQKIVIVKATPSNEMKIIKEIKLEDEIYPKEIYVDSKNLVIICSASIKSDKQEVDNKVSDEQKKVRILPYPYYNYRETTKALIYDIADKSDIKKIREVEVEGFYISSRKIANSLYLISNKNVYSTDKDTIVPIYKDSIVNTEYKSLSYSCIRYFPGVLESRYLIISGINLDNITEEAKIQAYLGAGENVYASTESLYVAITQYEPVFTIMRQEASVEKVKADTSLIGVPDYKQEEIKTKIFKFSIEGGQVTFLNKGEVVGTILNQFSMDESNNYFRIATTSGNSWSSGEDTSKNNLYILDETLSLTGKLEGLAPGEKIYSVRFMGDRAYVVTFKTVDPLFVIDLKDAKNPTVLGKLKIPGYSDYLHPYDENHIIGFGKDAVEVKGNAFYLGMKIVLFDVSDVANPIQKFSETIGDRGTDSELLRNHKALLFSKEKGLLAFPVTLMKLKEGDLKQSVDGIPQYGTFAYQGAYVYDINLTDGFKLKGKITHISDEEYLKSGDYWYDGRKNVDRIIYIGDTFYTLSQGMIKANEMNDLTEKGCVEISK